MKKQANQNLLFNFDKFTQIRKINIQKVEELTLKCRQLSLDLEKAAASERLNTAGLRRQMPPHRKETEQNGSSETEKTAQGCNHCIGLGKTNGRRFF